LTPPDRAVVVVPGLGGIVELPIAHGQEEGVETEVLAGCPLLGLFQRLARRPPFACPGMGDEPSTRRTASASECSTPSPHSFFASSSFRHWAAWSGRPQAS
jgi:hypothetical protein